MTLRFLAWSTGRMEVPMPELGRTRWEQVCGGETGSYALGDLHARCRLDIPSRDIQGHQAVISDLENDT